MFALNSEDHHESGSKGKPRSPKSQGAHLSSDPRTTLGVDLALGGVPFGPNRGLPLCHDNPSVPAEPVSSSRLYALSSTSNINSTSAANATAIAANLAAKSVTGDAGIKKKPRAQSEPASTIASVLSIPNALNVSIERATLKDYKRVAQTLLLSFEDDPFVNYIMNTSHIKKEKGSSVYKKKKLDLMLAYFEYCAYECLSINGVIYVIKDNNTEALLDEMGTKKVRFPYLAVSLWNQIYGPDVDSGYSSSASSDSEEDWSDDDYFASESLGFRESMHSSYLKFNIYSILGNCRSKIIKDKLPFLIKVRNRVLVDQLIKKEKDKNLDIWYLSDIATLPSMRGKGLGKILIQYVINEHINKASSKAFVYLESSNPVNRKFYSKLGFELMTSFSIKYNKYVDSKKIVHDDPLNKAINMDSMVFFPSTATISPPKF